MTSQSPSSETRVEVHITPPIDTVVPFAKATIDERKAILVEPTSVREKDDEEDTLLATGSATLSQMRCTEKTNVNSWRIAFMCHIGVTYLDGLQRNSGAG